MASKSLTPVSAPYRAGLGPYDASMVCDGDYTELSNGYKIECHPAQIDHAGSNLAGGMVLKSDPRVKDGAVDLGIVFNDGKNLRAPDVAIGDLGDEPGWATRMPPLCVEYAGPGQKERDLQTKIQELLTHGVQHIWVVRLVGALRVEVYQPGQPMRVVHDGEELSAPGVLANRYTPRDLVDGEAANAATLRNLLNRKGHNSLDEALEHAQDLGLKQGQAQGKAELLLKLLRKRGLAQDEASQRRIQSCQDPAQLDRWFDRALTAAAAAEIFDSAQRSGAPFIDGA